MAPEQAAGKTQEIGPAADIYALGVILYEMLTGRLPLRGVTRVETLQLVMQDDPIPPRRLQPNVPGDLEIICLKCLRKTPEKRYSSALELADDLRRFLDGEPIRARPVGFVEGGVTWVRRHATATALIILGLVLSLGAVGWSWHARDLQTERRQRAIETAIEKALKGDVELAEEFIVAAERQGASAGKVHFLRGLAYFHKADVQPAIDDHLEPAAQLLPYDVAVRALLAIYCTRTGQWERRVKWMKEVNGMEARTPEDLLFKGYEQSLMDPQGGLDTLSQAIARRDTNVARAIRAEVLARYALEWTKPAEAAQAQNDAVGALYYLPDNPFVLAASAQANYVAFILAKERGDAPKLKIALEKMKDNVEALEKFPKYPWGGMCRWLFHREICGGEDAAIRALEQTATESEKSDAKAEYATDLYRRGKNDEALGWLKKQKQRKTWHGDFLEICLIAERNDEKANDQAFKAWEKQYSDVDIDLYGAFLLLFQGRKQKVEAYVNRKRVFDKHSNPPGKNEFHEQVRAFVRAFVSGNKPASKDLVIAAGEKRSWQTRAHFLIAITCLADGKREQAMDHFKIAADKRNYLIGPFWLSLAMLARMEDPAWPPWLIGKTGNKK